MNNYTLFDNMNRPTRKKVTTTRSEYDGDGKLIARFVDETVEEYTYPHPVNDVRVKDYTRMVGDSGYLSGGVGNG